MKGRFDWRFRSQNILTGTLELVAGGVTFRGRLRLNADGSVDRAALEYSDFTELSTHLKGSSSAAATRVVTAGIKSFVKSLDKFTKDLVSPAFKRVLTWKLISEGKQSLLPLEYKDHTLACVNKVVGIFIGSTLPHVHCYLRVNGDVSYDANDERRRFLAWLITKYGDIEKKLVFWEVCFTHLVLSFPEPVAEIYAVVRKFVFPFIQRKSANVGWIRGRHVGNHYETSPPLDSISRSQRLSKVLRGTLGNVEPSQYVSYVTSHECVARTAFHCPTINVKGIGSQSNLSCANNEPSLKMFSYFFSFFVFHFPV